MEELRKLEEVQRVLTLIQPPGITDDNEDRNCFLSKLTLLLVQPCGELDLQNKCILVSQYMPKISAAVLDQASNKLTAKGYEENCVESCLPLDVGHKSESGPLQTKFEEIAMVGLAAMQRANSTLEDFCRSYFMFHGMDINKPQSLFQYLPMLSFVESYIYQLDDLNEKTVQASSSKMSISEGGTEVEGNGKVSQFGNVFKSYPFKPLECLLESHVLLTKRVQDEFKSGEEYWALERKLCHALNNKMQISVEDAVKAVHLKSFDYRVLNLLLYQLRGEKIDELHMEFLSVSEFLVEVADDLFDYEEDVLENNFNILRMFVRIYGATSPAVLVESDTVDANLSYRFKHYEVENTLMALVVAKYITEAEEKYNQVLKALDPQLSMHYQRRCVEATKEGGNKSGHPLGTWNIPSLILDEEFYRSSLLDTK